MDRATARIHTHGPGYCPRHNFLRMRDDVL